MVQNIAQAFNVIAAQHPERTAIIEAKTGVVKKFSEIRQLSDGYGAHLSSQGIKAGDRVVLMVTPSAEFLALTFGLFKLGVTIILIDPGMGYKNLLRCIEKVKPDVFIGIPKAVLFKKCFPAPFKTIRHTFCCGNSLMGFLGQNISKIAKSYSDVIPVYEPTEDDLAAIIFTTGSTGPPKGVRYEHAIFNAQLQRIRDFYGINDKDIDQPAFPLFGLFSAALGACCVIPDMNPSKPAQVDPEKFISSIIANNVSYSFGSPAIWNVVSQYCVQHNIVLESLRLILMAGAPVPGALLKRMRKIVSEDTHIATPYGATESLPILSIESHEILTETWDLSRVGKGTCVGKPLPGIDIRILKINEDPIPRYEPSLEVPQGEIGEIVVRGDVVTRSYENNPHETALAKIYDDNSFWHRMGDVGYLDDKDRLWFCGRKGHRVETESGTLFTVKCEAIVNEHEDVYRSALVGVKQSGEPGNMPVLIIEPVKKFQGDGERLLTEVRELSQNSPETRQINTFLLHPSFPVDIRHNAKIFREKLAVWAQKELDKKR